MKAKHIESILLFNEIEDLETEEEFEFWLDHKAQKWENAIDSAISEMDMVELDRTEAGLFE